MPVVRLYGSEKEQVAILCDYLNPRIVLEGYYSSSLREPNRLLVYEAVPFGGASALDNPVGSWLPELAAR